HHRRPAPRGRHPRHPRRDGTGRGRPPAGRHRHRRRRRPDPRRARPVAGPLPGTGSSTPTRHYLPVAEIITVDDPDDPRLRDYTALTDVELRRRREPAEGLFIAEGEKVIRRARHAGYEMRSMLLSAKWVDVMRDVIDEVPAPVYAVSPDLAERVTGYHVHRGALASMQRKPLPAPAALLAGARGTAVREAVTDHTNIAAIFRSAAALGMDAMLLSPDCADPLYRRSVKVSMGAVFSVPYARLESWPRDLATVREAGFKLL